MTQSDGDTRSQNFTSYRRTVCNKNGEDALRVGAIVLIGVAGILLILVFIVGARRLFKDCKQKNDAKRAAQERLDFESITYDLGLDERDRLSEGSDESSLSTRQEPIIHELHFPVTRANEIQMSNSLQTVGNLSAFTNVGHYYDNKGWGSPSHQALYRGDDKIVETDFSRAANFPAWHTSGTTTDTTTANNQTDQKFMYVPPRDISQAQIPPTQREMNNFVALQMASQNHRVYSSPNNAHKKPKGSQLFVPSIQSTSNLAAVQMTARNFENSPRPERRLHEVPGVYYERSVHSNAYFIDDDKRTDHSDFHEVKTYKTRENLRYPGKAQNVRVPARRDDVYEPSRAPVLGKDAEYWNYVTSKVRTPTPDLNNGRYEEAKKAAKSNKGHKAGKREKTKQHEVKQDNSREKTRQNEVKHDHSREKTGQNEAKQENAREKTRKINTLYEDSEEFDTDNARPLSRTERSLSTKKKEDLLVSELKARLGTRQGSPGADEELFF